MRPDRTGPRPPMAGFRLIELLVVVALLGIVAGAMLQSFLHQREKAAEVAIQSDLRNAAHEIEARVADGGSYAEVTVAGLAHTRGVTLTLTSQDARTYCLDGVSVHTDVTYHYDAAGGGLEVGSCGEIDAS